MDQRNIEFMFYGLASAWVILGVYALTLLTRERKIDAELKRLRGLVENREETK
ncbi:MAG: hypothetical protein IPM24_15185 [Bryobacterales bacterium]|jgi:hypothetical protein|nr:hypothetical protein [Bryobacterales bacterium]